MIVRLKIKSGILRAAHRLEKASLLRLHLSPLLLACWELVITLITLNNPVNPNMHIYIYIYIYICMYSCSSAVDASLAEARAAFATDSYTVLSEEGYRANRGKNLGF